MTGSLSTPRRVLGDIGNTVGQGPGSRTEKSNIPPGRKLAWKKLTGYGTPQKPKSMVTPRKQVSVVAVATPSRTTCSPAGTPRSTPPPTLRRTPKPPACTPPASAKVRGSPSTVISESDAKSTVGTNTPRSSEFDYRSTPAKILEEASATVLVPESPADPLTQSSRSFLVALSRSGNSKGDGWVDVAALSPGVSGAEVSDSRSHAADSPRENMYKNEIIRLRQELVEMHTDMGQYATPSPPDASSDSKKKLFLSPGDRMAMEVTQELHELKQGLEAVREQYRKVQLKAFKRDYSAEKSNFKRVDAIMRKVQTMEDAYNEQIVALEKQIEDLHRSVAVAIEKELLSRERATDLESQVIVLRDAKDLLEKQLRQESFRAAEAAKILEESSLVSDEQQREVDNALSISREKEAAYKDEIRMLKSRMEDIIRARDSALADCAHEVLVAKQAEDREVKIQALYAQLKSADEERAQYFGTMKKQLVAVSEALASSRRLNGDMESKVEGLMEQNLQLTEAKEKAEDDHDLAQVRLKELQDVIDNLNKQNFAMNEKLEKIAEEKRAADEEATITTLMDTQANLVESIDALRRRYNIVNAVVEKSLGEESGSEGEQDRGKQDIGTMFQATEQTDSATLTEDTSLLEEMRVQSAFQHLMDARRALVSTRREEMFGSSK